MSNESIENLKPLDVSHELIDMDYSDLRRFLLQKIRDNPTSTFVATIDWVSKQTARKAKACLDDSNLNFTSITVRATRKQYEEDVNAFASGVKWEEIF